jgi:hypothetical protein
MTLNDVADPRLQDFTVNCWILLVLQPTSLSKLDKEIALFLGKKGILLKVSYQIIKWAVLKHLLSVASMYCWIAPFRTAYCFIIYGGSNTD